MLPFVFFSPLFPPDRALSAPAWMLSFDIRPTAAVSLSQTLLAGRHGGKEKGRRSELTAECGDVREPESLGGKQAAFLQAISVQSVNFHDTCQI